MDKWEKFKEEADKVLKKIKDQKQIPAQSDIRWIRLPSGGEKYIKDDGKPKDIEIGAGGWGTCPVCETDLRLPDPSNPKEGEGLCICPVCRVTLRVSIMK